VKPWCVLVLGEVFQWISWLPGGGGLTAPYTRSNRPLWTDGFRVVSAVVGACVLRLLVEFVPRTSSTPVATWFWQTEGRRAERVILGVRPSVFIFLEFQSPSRRIFIDSHSLPPLWERSRGHVHSVSGVGKGRGGAGERRAGSQERRPPRALLRARLVLTGAGRGGAGKEGGVHAREREGRPL
jgi:hypothetical protein